MWDEDGAMAFDLGCDEPAAAAPVAEVSGEDDFQQEQIPADIPVSSPSDSDHPEEKAKESSEEEEKAPKKTKKKKAEKKEKNPAKKEKKPKKESKKKSDKDSKKKKKDVDETVKRIVSAKLVEQIFAERVGHTPDGKTAAEIAKHVDRKIVAAMYVAQCTSGKKKKLHGVDITRHAIGPVLVM